MLRVSRRDRREGLGLWSGEGGQSLVEELVAVAVVSLALMILIAALSTGSVGGRTTNDLVMAENLAHSQLELIKDAAYSPNPTIVPYPTVAPVAGYNVTTVVEYWIAPNGPFTSTVRNDRLQKLTISISGSKGTLLQLEGYKVER